MVQEDVDDWRKSNIVPIYKNKGYMQNWEIFMEIKLLSHTMKAWER